MKLRLDQMIIKKGERRMDCRDHKTRSKTGGRIGDWDVGLEYLGIRGAFLIPD